MVTGLGAVTPIGNDVETSWASALAGRSGVDWIRAFDPSGFPVRVAAEDLRTLYTRMVKELNVQPE